MGTETPTSWTAVTLAQLLSGGGNVLKILSQTATTEFTVTEQVLKDYILNGLSLSGVTISNPINLSALPTTGDTNTVYFVQDYDGNGNSQIYLWNATTTAYEEYPKRIMNVSSPISGDGLAASPLTITNAAIALSKLVTGTSDTLIGYGSGATPSAQEITIGSGLSLSGGTLSANASSGTGITEGYDAGNRTIIDCTRNGNDITTTLSGGVLTITIPAGETIRPGGNYVFVPPPDCVYNGGASSSDSFKIIIDNSANNLVSTFKMEAYRVASSITTIASSAAPHRSDFNLNGDRLIENFAVGLFSVVFQSLGTRATGGAFILF